MDDKEKKKLEQAEKAAQKMKKGLDEGQKKNPVKAHGTSEIQKRVKRIRDNIDLYTSTRQDIIKDLLYLQEHQKELKAELNITFKEFIESIGTSKTDFYRQIGNYKFLIEHKKPELIESVDPEIIRLISLAEKGKQDELLRKAHELTRNDPRLKKTESHGGTEKTEKPGGRTQNIIDADYTVTEFPKEITKRIIQSIETELKKLNEEDAETVCIDVSNYLRKRK